MRRGAGGSASLASSSTTKTGTTPKAACSTSCSKTRASFRSPSTRAGVASASSDSASSSSAFNRARLERSRCSAAASSGLADKPVAESTNRLDPARLLQSAPDLVRRLLDAEHLASRSVTRAGEDDHRKRDPISSRSQRVEDFGSLHVGHLIVEQHQVGRPCVDAREGFGPADSDLDHVARAPQQRGGHLRRAWLIVDDKQPGHPSQTPTATYQVQGFFRKT